VFSEWRLSIVSELLNVKNLGISFGHNAVLKSVSFNLNQNEVLGIIGPNGAGKTVLLSILSGILKAEKGTVTFEGRDITNQGINERCREGIGVTFQVPRPFEKMTVFENLMVGAVFGDKMSERQAKKKAVEIAEMIGLSDKLDWFAGKLGLLDRKRLEIGRALATNPKILLLDEVGGGLTEAEVGMVIQLVKDLKAKGLGIIWIEHIIRTMLEGADRVLLLANGVDVISGKPEEVMNSREVKEVYMGGEDDSATKPIAVDAERLGRCANWQNDTGCQEY
jgi:branched-chain amino acid transport system ATP-binding protein